MASQKRLREDSAVGRRRALGKNQPRLVVLEDLAPRTDARRQRGQLKDARTERVIIKSLKEARINPVFNWFRNDNHLAGRNVALVLAAQRAQSCALASTDVAMNHDQRTLAG